jgi:hypothetical protein
MAAISVTLLIALKIISFQKDKDKTKQYYKKLNIYDCKKVPAMCQ